MQPQDGYIVPPVNKKKLRQKVRTKKISDDERDLILGIDALESRSLSTEPLLPTTTPLVSMLKMHQVTNYKGFYY